MRLIPFSAMYAEVEPFRIEIMLPLILHKHSNVIPRSEFLPGLLALKDNQENYNNNNYNHYNNNK